MTVRWRRLSRQVGALAFACSMGIWINGAGATDRFRTIQLSDGAIIDLGDQAELVEQAINNQQLVGLARGFLSRGLIADAAAVLTYALRYRPDRTKETLESAAQLAAQYNNAEFAGLAFSAMAAEASVSAAALTAALQSVLLPRPLQAVAFEAAGLPFPSGEADGATTADVSDETDASPQVGRSADEVFGTSLLPDVLRIGGGGGGTAAIPGTQPNVNETGTDGGAS